MTDNSGPGFRNKPDHRVDLEPGPERVRVLLDGETIADTHGALTVNETGYEPVHYIPAADVREDVLVPSTHTSYCPFKGEAHYWSIALGDKTAENAVWAYNEPYDEVMPLKGRFAFYPRLVDIIAE